MLAGGGPMCAGGALSTGNASKTFSGTPSGSAFAGGPAFTGGCFPKTLHGIGFADDDELEVPTMLASLVLGPCFPLPLSLFRIVCHKLETIAP